MDSNVCWCMHSCGGLSCRLSQSHCWWPSRYTISFLFEHWPKSSLYVYELRYSIVTLIYTTTVKMIHTVKYLLFIKTNYGVFFLNLRQLAVFYWLQLYKNPPNLDQAYQHNRYPEYVLIASQMSSEIWNA